MFSGNIPLFFSSLHRAEQQILDASGSCAGCFRAARAVRLVAHGEEPVSRTKTKKSPFDDRRKGSMLKKKVRLIGLEPTRLATPDPKSGAYTNFATGAFQLQKYIMCHDFQRKGRTFFVQWWRIRIFVIQTLCRYELCPVVSLR